jgi:CRP-like cAMP-binding protein
MKLKNLLILLKHVKIKTYKKGEILIPGGSQGTKIFFVRKGLIRSYYINANADEITFQLYPESNFLGNIHSIAFNEPSKYIYECLEKSKLYEVDFHSFRKKLAESGELDLDRNWVFQQIMRQSFRRVEALVLLSPEERYQKYVSDYPNVINRAPDKYIANVLGITPVSLSRIRSRMASRK